MITILIALGLIVVMLILGLGSSVLWMRPATRRPDIVTRSSTSIEAGSMTLGTNDETFAA